MHLLCMYVYMYNVCMCTMYMYNVLVHEMYILAEWKNLQKSEVQLKVKINFTN